MWDSEDVKQLWQNPEYRKKQVEVDKERKRKASIALKKHWADPENRARRIAVMTSPHVQRRQAAAMAIRSKELWKDPTYRAAQGAHRSAFAKTRSGITAPGFKHGLSRTPEYRAYHQAKARCTKIDHQHYSEYGMRGIKFLFASFEQFIAHIGMRPSAKHSLDRINNDGHYEIGNVAWRTATEQVINRRKANSNCRACGKLLSCSCMEPEYGLSAC
jgi:hypothetical protein